MLEVPSDQQSSVKPTFKDQTREVQPRLFPFRPTDIVATPQDNQDEPGRQAVSELTGPEERLQQTTSATVVVEAVQVSPEQIVTAEPYNQPPTDEPTGRHTTTDGVSSKEKRWRYLAAILGAGVIVLMTMIGCFSTDLCSPSQTERMIQPTLSPAPAVLDEFNTLSPVWDAQPGNFTNRRARTDVLLRFDHVGTETNMRLTENELGALIAVVGTVVDTYITGLEKDSSGLELLGFQLQKVEVEKSSPMATVDEVLEAELTITIFYSSKLILDTVSWIRTALLDTSDLLRQLRNVNNQRFQRVRSIKVAVDGLPLDGVASVSPLHHASWNIFLGTLLWVVVNIVL